MFRLQTSVIDLSLCQTDLSAMASGQGAEVTFVGRVRPHQLKKTNDIQEIDPTHNGSSSFLNLESWPDLANKQLQNLSVIAHKKWTLDALMVVHRYGKIAVGEVIVFVGVTSKHRHDAFEACQFIMDELKTKVALWKQDITDAGQHWHS